MDADTFLNDFAREAIQEFYDQSTSDTRSGLWDEAERFIHNETQRATNLIRLALRDEANRLIHDVHTN